MSNINLLGTELHRQAMQAERTTLCSYLLSLAAVQRGLNVEFCSQLHRHRIFRGAPPSFIPAYFRVSDSRGREVLFDRSRGQKSLVAASLNSTDKYASKRIFQSVGVSVADGIHCSSKNVVLEAEKLKNSDGLYIVKPLKGSLGKGVVLGLTLERAINYVKNMAGEFIIERMICGSEFRVAVVNGRAVSSFERLAPSIVGDGIKNIWSLVEELNERLRSSPHSKTSVIEMDKLLLAPALSGKTFDFVPKFLEKIVLSEKNFDPGREIKHATSYVPAVVIDEAVKAANVIGLPNCGVDVLYDPVSKKGYVLEANPRHHLGGHTFPTIGNGDGLAVPNAIIDYYFPDTKNVSPDCDFSLDFEAVNAALNTMGFDSVRPVARQHEWVKRTVRVRPSCVDVDQIKKMLRLMCLYVVDVRRTTDECTIAAYFDKAALSKILKSKRGSKKIFVSEDVDKQLFASGRA